MRAWVRGWASIEYRAVRLQSERRVTLCAKHRHEMGISTRRSADHKYKRRQKLIKFSNDIFSNMNIIDDNNHFIKLKNEYKSYHNFYEKNNNIAQHGGRSELLNQLKNIKKFKEYNDMRDRLDYETTNISAGLNFGCVSIREVYDIIIKKYNKPTKHRTRVPDTKQKSVI